MRWLGRGPLNSKVIRSKPGWWAVRTAISVGMTGAWALVWTAAVDESAANAGAAATTRAVVATAASNERTRMETPLMELLDPSPGYDQSVLALSRDDHGAASERPLHRFGMVTAISGDAARTASRSRPLRRGLRAARPRPRRPAWRPPCPRRSSGRRPRCRRAGPARRRPRPGRRPR